MEINYNIDDAVEFTQSAIENQTKQPLNDLSMAVLRGSLQGYSYTEIAAKNSFSTYHIKSAGTELWKTLSEALGVTIDKNHLITVIEGELRKQQQASVINTFISPEPPKIYDLEILPKCKDEVRDFVGRGAAITDINNLVNEGRKIIVIQAAGGVGKTTLAKQYLAKFDLVLPLEMAKEQENITPVESVVEEWLKQYFKEEPGREFGITLSRLKTQLQTRKVGVLIDNLEPALDERGRFVEKHNGYVRLLGILADANVQSVTLITSRERLCDDRVNGIYHYPLSVLDVTAWKEFFTSYEITIDPDSLKAIEKANQKVDEDDALKALVENPEKSPLEAMHKVYGGNAKAMDILLGVMREDYDRDMSAYWQENCTLVETELKNLVESQFNRLRLLDNEAYKLLCRLGCFRYQDVPRVSKDALLALLWDVPEDKRVDVIKSLRNRCLVEFEKGEYWLHPVIREQGIERLKISGESEEVNRKAAEFWTESVKSVESIQDARKAFEAYYHYLEIHDYEQAASVIVHRRNNKWVDKETLGMGLYRLGSMQQLTILVNQVINNISTESKLLLGENYNLLGDVYWLTGYIHKAIKCHELSKKFALEASIESLQIVSLFNIGLCQLDIWELKKAIIFFEEVISLAENTNFHKHAVASWYCLAFLNSLLGFNQKAYYFANKACNDYISLKNVSSWGKGYTLLFLGQTYKNLQELEKSFNIYNRAISYAKESNYTQVKAKALTGLAELYRIQDDFQQALFHHSESIELLNKIGAKCDLAEAYYQLGLTYQKMGETENSHINFNEAIRLFNEMEAPKQVEKVEKAKRGNIDS